jgi:hypothetical protein
VRLVESPARKRQKRQPCGEDRGVLANYIHIFTNINSARLDDPEFTPIFDRMAIKYDFPILLHPTRPATAADYKTETKSKFEVWQVLGWSHDSTVAMARIIFSGLFDKFPNLKILTHHLGNTAPYLEGRLGPLCVFDVGSRRRITLKEIPRREDDPVKGACTGQSSPGSCDAPSRTARRLACQRALRRAGNPAPSAITATPSSPLTT